MAGFSLDPSALAGSFLGQGLQNPAAAGAATPAPSSGGKYGGIDPTLLQKMMQSFGGSPAGGGAARQAAAQQMVGGGGADNLSFARKEMFSPQLMGAIDLASKVAPFL
jgi:hypothetical protein